MIMRSFYMGYAMNRIKLKSARYLFDIFNDVTSQCPLRSSGKLEINVANSNNRTFKRTIVANNCSYHQCSNVSSLG
jgi:hypothetical protein